MIQSKEIIPSRAKPRFLQGFFERTLHALGNEFKKIGRDIYTYPGGKRGIDDKSSINDVFALIERTYVGMLNNAVLKAFPSDATLQEFPVYSKNGFKGRADFLVVHNYDNGKYANLLFEAKASVFPAKDYKEVETSRYYKRLQAQAKGYFEAERSYYEGATYTIAITFDWIRDKETLHSVLNDPYTDNVTDFYIVYYTTEAGMSVSGNVEGPY